MQTDLAERLRVAIEDLSEQERLVTTLYFYEELTRNEIGLVLRLDANRVSQIRASAVMHLRAALRDLAPRVSQSRVPVRSPIALTPQHPLAAAAAA
jgi:RNA polymerase sigma factor for flagellar operon FliA